MPRRASKNSIDKHTSVVPWPALPPTHLSSPSSHPAQYHQRFRHQEPDGISGEALQPRQPCHHSHVPNNRTHNSEETNFQPTKRVPNPIVTHRRSNAGCVPYNPYQSSVDDNSSQPDYSNTNTPSPGRLNLAELSSPELSPGPSFGSKPSVRTDTCPMPSGATRPGKADVLAGAGGLEKPDRGQKKHEPSSHSQNIGILRSLRLIFSYTAKRDYVLLLLPALVFSVVSGLLPPYMTIMIGDAFESFTEYDASISAMSPDPTVAEEAKNVLRHRIELVAIKLGCIGAATCLLSLITHTLWAINGSKICQKIQEAIYDSVSQRELGWFEKGMHTQYKLPNKEEDTQGEGPDADDGPKGDQSATWQSPAGLMGRFARQTEDIRAAISGRFGLVIQYTVTMIANIILALTKSYKLSLVILCTIPVVALVTALSSRFAAPLLAEESVLESNLSTEIGRLVRTISVVKAFNAQAFEHKKLNAVCEQISKVYVAVVRIMALRAGICQTLSLMMFVQGFGFGSRLISSQEVSAGDVNTVFWSCLIASNYLQMLVPLLTYLEKARTAIFNLLALMEYSPSPALEPTIMTKGAISGIPDYQRPPDSLPMLASFDKVLPSGAPHQPSASSRSPTSTMLSSPSTTVSSLGKPDVTPKRRPLPPIPVHSASVAPVVAPSYAPSGVPVDALATQRQFTFRPVGRKAVRKLRKVIPTEFKGQLELKDVTFYYPSNEPSPLTDHSAISPTSTLFDRQPNLDSVSIFFPSGDFTFIIGESGSGKSTISAILMGLYPTMRGSVEVDEIGSISWLDAEWYRSQFYLVSGLTCNYVFPGTIHENIAIGVGSSRNWRTVTREEVIRAATFALLHEFIRDLPDGYDTRLVNDDLSTGEEDSGEDHETGEKRNGGIQNLSGGQKQRLGLARAWIRDPPVLILDEATSALDMTTQALMYEAIRQWRTNKTTICITHDLKPIRLTDYVYVMQHGRVVESDYRYKLEAKSLNMSVFKQMSRKTEKHKKTGLMIAPKVRLEDLNAHYPKVKFALQGRADGNRNIIENTLADRTGRSSLVHFAEPPYENRMSSPTSPNKSEKRVTFLNGFLLAMQSENGFLAPRSNSVTFPFNSSQNAWRQSISKPRLSGNGTWGKEWRSSIRERSSETSDVNDSPRRSQFARYSTEILKWNPFQSIGNRAPNGDLSGHAADHDYEVTSAHVMYQTSKMAAIRRLRTADGDGARSEHRKKWSKEELQKAVDASESPHENPNISPSRSSIFHHRINMGTNSSNSTWSMIELARNVSPTLSGKWMMLFGCSVSILSGAMTPLFSVVLGQLLSHIANPPSGYILRLSIYIILISIADGFLAFGRIFVMERASTLWLEGMRKVASEKIPLQDQQWFDQDENSPSNLISRLNKDGVDCKDLIGQILADVLTLLTLLTLAFLWALILGWQLTLVGLSLAPVFFFIIGGGGKVGAKFEHMNKVLREQVANQFYQTISNVKAIRSMSIEQLLRERFLQTAEKSRKMFIKSAPFGGMSYGLNVAMTYVAEGLMFYVGGIFVINGLYTFAKLSQVFSLIIFSVTFAGQMITSIPSYSRSVRATMDLLRLVNLPKNSSETKGDLCIPLEGRVEFQQVNFSYPSRPNVQVLKSVSFVIEVGECVGIVGASGSGKSTVASLLHRLYEPNSGSIRLDGFKISQIDSRHVREHIGIVTQQPVMFNDTVINNVSYGYVPLSGRQQSPAEIDQQLIRAEVERVIEKAHLARFVESLPHKLDTKIGENSDLISSGQAQRLSIARTLMHKNRKVLVFDECTSALDLINQASILKTIEEVKAGKTSIIITHKAAVMQMCDRLIVMDHGRVVEQGSYNELMKKPKGVLRTLSKGGEWTN